MPSSRHLSAMASHHKAGSSEWSGSGTQIFISLKRKEGGRFGNKKHVSEALSVYWSPTLWLLFEFRHSSSIATSRENQVNLGKCTAARSPEDPELCWFLFFHLRQDKFSPLHPLFLIYCNILSHNLKSGLKRKKKKIKYFTDYFHNEMINHLVIWM